eukprot:gene7686-biopygen2027
MALHRALVKSPVKSPVKSVVKSHVKSPVKSPAKGPAKSSAGQKPVSLAIGSMSKSQEANRSAHILAVDLKILNNIEDPEGYNTVLQMKDL